MWIEIGMIESMNGDGCEYRFAHHRGSLISILPVSCFFSFSSSLYLVKV